MERIGGQHVWWPGVEKKERDPLVIAVGDRQMKAALGNVVGLLKEKREEGGEWEGEEGEWLIHVGATGHKMAKICRGEANCYLQVLLLFFFFFFFFFSFIDLCSSFYLFILLIF